MPSSLGRRFAEALADKDADRLRSLLADDVDFKGLTPGRFWEGSAPEAVLNAALGSWFGPDDDIRQLLWVEDGDPVSDTDRVSYRLLVRNGDGDHHVEQQGYYRARDGRIAHLRLLCSGYRPLD